MKISFSFSSTSPSSSSPSCSSSTTSFENVTTKCFSSIIRRFFGTGNLRTHPFDCISNQVVECDHRKEPKLEEEEEEKIEAKPTPGLVARLMGLETMPELDKKMNLESIGRSRSANSLEYSSDFDANNRQHRRVKTSWSFRDMSTVLQLENDEFLILTFDNVGEDGEFGSKGRKAELGSGELKPGKVDGSKNKENRIENKRVSKKKKMEMEEQESIKKDRKELRMSRGPRRECGSKIQDLGSFCQHKGASDGSKSTKKKKCRPVLKKVEAECNSENSSPVSVLNLTEFQIDHEFSLSEEEIKRTDSNSRRKLSSDYPSHRFTGISIITDEIQESRSINSECTESEKLLLDSNIKDDYMEVWEEVCKLTEQDMKTSKWVLKEMQKMEQVEEIGTDIGQEIFDQFLQEIVTEVGGFSKKTNFAL